MNDKRGKGPDAAREKRLIESLRRHPELMERFEAILELTNSEEGPLRTADEIEEMLVEEVRRLGQRAMQDWAGGAEERVAEEMRQSLPGVRVRKKSPELVVRLWGGGHRGADLACARLQLPEGLHESGGGQRTGQIPPAATSLKRFRGRAFLPTELPAPQRALWI
ncbi:MAG TPA: hypothetical protein VIT91_12725 [Chthoniobacterales bacterium]